MCSSDLSIKARNVVDFSASYDVIDSKTGNKLGALRRKGWASILRDSWEVLDADDVVIGKIEEDSMGIDELAMRRALQGA